MIRVIRDQVRARGIVRVAVSALQNTTARAWLNDDPHGTWELDT